MREDPGVGRSGWLAVVPIKPLPAAKSRLRGAVAGVPHERLGEPAVLTVDGAPQPDGWKVPAPGGPVVLTPVRVLHAGEPLDRDRFPKPLERWTSRAANGPAHEVRWLSRATSADGADGMALHESVEFGRVRTASA